MVYSADKALGHERFGLVAAIFARQVDDNWFAIWKADSNECIKVLPFSVTGWYRRRWL